MKALFGLCALACVPSAALAKPLFPNPQFTTARPDRAMSADFDGDGRLDLAITTVASPPRLGDVLVLHGEGDGTFSRETRLGVGGPALAAGDFNGDGFADLVATMTDAVVLFPGRGDGTFGPGLTTALTGVRDLATGDVDGDGRDDLAVASDEGCRVLFADADGSFAPPAAVVGGSDARFRAPGDGDGGGGGIDARLVALGDFDGDRRLDLACLVHTSGGLDVLQFTRGQGDGGFVSTHQVATPGRVTRLVAGDLDADGRSDAAILLSPPDIGSAPPIMVYFSDPDGVSPVGPLAGWWSWLSIGDIDGDGQADLVSSIWGRSSVLVHTAPRAFSALPDQMVMAPGHALGDFDGDGRLDLVVPQEKTVFMGRGDGTFDIPRIPGFGGLNAFSVATPDLNEDGIPDIVTGERALATMRTARPAGGFDPPGFVWVGMYQTEVAVCDFDGDGHQDMLGVDSDTFFAQTRLFPGHGDGTVSPSFSSVVWGPGKVISGDINHDGRGDFIVANLLPAVSVFLGNGDLLLDETSTTTIAGPHAPALGDYDEDGRIDVVVAADTGLAFQHGMGDGTFGPPVVLGTSPKEWDVEAADFDRDGHLDIAVAGEGEAAVLFGHGDGTFEPRVVVDSGWSFRSIVASDFDGDGWPDLFIAVDNAFFGPVYTLRDGEYFALFHPNRHDRSFGPASTRQAMGSWTYQMTTTDFDRDGLPDIAAATDLGVMLLMNRGVLDSDGDGVLDGADCAPADAGAFAPPAEVSGVVVTGTGLAGADLGWTSQAATAGPATVYDVARGALPVSGEAVACLLDGTPATTCTDAETPSAGAGFWYLVRATNVCGTGGYGSSSDGTPRSIDACP